MFSQNVYNVTILENTKIGTQTSEYLMNMFHWLINHIIINYFNFKISDENVLQVQATDDDTGINANLSYKIEKGSYNDFTIDSETGVIKVASKLDYDRRKIYNITVIATDGGRFLKN